MYCCSAGVCLRASAYVCARTRGPHREEPAREGTPRSRTGRRMVTGPSVSYVARCPMYDTKDRLKKALSSQKIYVPSVYRLLSSGAEQLAPHVTRDEIIMMRASSGARRLYAISTRPASTAAGAIFQDSLSFSTELSLHRRRPARGSEATGRVVSHD